MRTAALTTAATIAALVTAIAGGTVTRTADAAPAQGSGCQPAWRLVAAPPAPGATAYRAYSSDAHLVSVSVISPREVRFSGYQGNDGSSSAQPWTLNWDGNSVSATAPDSALPFTQAGDTSIAYDPASFDTADDGWMLDDPRMATGYIDPDISVAEHWHNGRWAMTPMAVSPDPKTNGIWLQTISAVSPSDAWAAGALYAVGPGNLFGLSPIGTLIEHWDGRQWHIIANPASTHAAVVDGLDVLAPDDIWAAGQQLNSSGTAWLPLIEHWNGTAWQLLAAPPGRGSSWLDAISAGNGHDAWTVGYQAAAGSQTTYVPLIEHWNGTAWSIVSLPDGGAGLSGLVGVYVASASDIWAIFGGSQYELGPAALGQPQAFLHWNGRQWTTIPEPGPQEYGMSYAYNAIGGTGPDDVWAAGQAGATAPGYTAPVIAHLSCN